MTCCGSARPRPEHDAFCEVMRERGVEVFEAERLLAEALAEPGAREWVCEHILERARGRHRRRRTGPRVGRARPSGRGGRVPVGGITRSDVNQDVGLVWESADPTSMLLPPLPNFLFQRDPSCWIFDGVTHQPDDQAGAQAGDDDHGDDLPVPPDVRRRKVPDLAGRSDEDWGRCHVEGGDVQPIGNGTVMIGMGERTTPQAVLWIARALFRAGSASRCSPCTCPSRAATCTWTRSSPCVDRDLVTLFPPVVDGARTWAIRPGASPDDLVVEEQPGTLPEHMARGAGRRRRCG